MDNANASYGNLLNDLRTHYNSGQTKSLASRLNALTRLEQTIRDNIDAICQALHDDLRKPKQESLISEISVVLEEIAVAKKNLKNWMRPHARNSPLGLWPSKNRIYYEPLGIVLIISPWNYPFQLALAPLVGAIAAGNCTIVKPSEMTPHVSQLLKSLITQCFPSQFATVILGAIPETTALLSLKFDHIFFTGSTAVGKIIMQAAAKNLTPVTLELGGKSPAIVHEDADLDLTARRIVWGKFYNAGQTCVAPDYLYVHEGIAAQLIEKLKAEIQKQFGAGDRQASPDFARIVNTKNAQRLVDLIDKDKVTFGGQSDVSSCFIEPTLIQNASWDDKIMSEEIFGPILPILTYTDLEKLLSLIRSKPKALSAYFFSGSRTQQNYFIENLSFGGGCINDVVVHLGNPFLPFGGVGDSGFGHYHGTESFKTFSHTKSVMFRYGLFDFSARYAPYSGSKLSFLRKMFGV